MARDSNVAQPFESLYSHVRRSDIRLYKTFKRIEAEIKRLSDLASSVISDIERRFDVTALHIPYASADGVLGDTTMEWNNSTFALILKHISSGGIYVEGYGAGIFGILKIKAAEGTATAPSALGSGRIIGHLGFQGYGATGWGGASSAAIVGRTTEAFTDTTKGTEILVQVTPNGSVSRVTAITVGQDSTATTKSIVPVADSAHSLGSTGLRWLKLWVDDIQVTTDVEVSGAVHAVGQIRTDTKFNFNGTDGLTGGRFVKDGAGVTQTVTIEGGIITGWTL